MIVLASPTDRFFYADVQVLVNTVNLNGKMGKGIAAAFKKLFPENFERYAEACENKEEIGPGVPLVVRMPQSWQRPDRWLCRYVVNVPTKRGWRDKSLSEDVEKGLDFLRVWMYSLSIESACIPALGCGNGGLDWAVVQELINQKLGSLHTRVLLFPPNTGF